MLRSTFPAALFVCLTVLAFATLPSNAKEPPAMIYVKAKCALCHGADGSANTPAGRQSGARDFRAPEVQNMSDDQLASVISDGNGKMPAFNQRLNSEEVRLMVAYVRELGAGK